MDYTRILDARPYKLCLDWSYGCSGEARRAFRFLYEQKGVFCKFISNIVRRAFSSFGPEEKVLQDYNNIMTYFNLKRRPESCVLIEQH